MIRGDEGDGNNAGVLTVISCPKPSAVADTVSLSSPSSPVEEEAEGIIPYPWEVSLAFLSSMSYLGTCSSDGVVRITMSNDKERASTSSRLEYPDLDPEGGPCSKFPSQLRR